MTARGLAARPRWRQPTPTSLMGETGRSARLRPFAHSSRIKIAADDNGSPESIPGTGSTPSCPLWFLLRSERRAFCEQGLTKLESARALSRVGQQGMASQRRLRKGPGQLLPPGTATELLTERPIRLHRVVEGLFVRLRLQTLTRMDRLSRERATAQGYPTGWGADRLPVRRYGAVALMVAGFSCNGCTRISSVSAFASSAKWNCMSMRKGVAVSQACSVSWLGFVQAALAATG